MSRRLRSLPFWPLAASEPSCALPFVPLPHGFLSPSSLSLPWNLLLCPLLSLSPLASALSFWEDGRWATTASLVSACEACPFWPATSDRQRRGLPHTSHTSAQCCLTGDVQCDRGSDLMSCNAWQRDCPNILAFIFLPPREVPLGTGSSGRFLYSGIHTGENPIYGLSYRQCTTDWFPGLITPVGSGQGAPSFTGPFWTCQVSVWIDVAISLSLFQAFLSLLPLPLPLSSHHHSQHFYPEKSLVVSKFCDWYLWVVVLSVQLPLQVSTDIVGTVEHLSLGIQT